MDKQQIAQDILKKYGAQGFTPANNAPVDLSGRFSELDAIASSGIVPSRRNRENTNNATFQATGNENLLSGTAKAIGNVPRSTFNLAKNVVSAVVNPIDTVKSVGKIVQGVGAKVGEKLFEETDFGQKLLEGANKNRISKGLPELQRDANGKLQAQNTPELETINKLGEFFVDRYGSVDNFQKTLIEDPAGALADIATVVGGGGALASKVGNVSKVSEISNIGKTLSSASQAIEPISAISKVTGKAARGVKNSKVGQIASEIIPTRSDIQQTEVVKALDLTQGDLINIGKKTGNDVTKFIIDKNLIKDTPEAIVDALNDFRKTAKTEKANVISQVTSVYTPEQVPSVIKGLDTIFQDIDGVAGLEKIADEIKTLRSKKQFTLEDVQNAQYLIDENSSIYSKVGDTKSSKTAKGLDNIRKDIRSFIENEVDTATNGNTNIRKMNNDIQTSFAIEDAINTRATRNQTRNMVGLRDQLVLFGGATAINPAIGVGLFIGKKIIESPSFRLGFVKALESKPIAKVNKMITEIKNKTVSLETQAFIKEVANEVAKNKAVIESGSAILDKTK